MMYGFCMKSASFLVRHPFLYYLLAWTWGLPASILGLLAGIAMAILLRPPLRFQRMIYFTIGRSWGGFSLGCVFVRDEQSDGSICWHEYGHSYQNAILGPLFLILVAIPSCVRYFIYEAREALRKPNNDYDAIWFEGSATDIGNAIKEHKI